MGVVNHYDDKLGIGMIKCSSVNEDIPFYRSGVPTKNRPKGAVLEGQKVSFSYLINQGSSYATALRFVTSRIILGCSAFLCSTIFPRFVSDKYNTLSLIQK